MEAFAEIVDPTTIAIVAKGVRKLWVHLHPDMGLAFDRNLHVIVNDELRFDGSVSADMRHLFAHAREWDDRGRLYRARVAVTVTTDREVGTPFAPP